MVDEKQIIKRFRGFEKSANLNYDLWDQCDFKRRAAVLVILYNGQDLNGNSCLSVVLTLRSSKMRVSPGLGALPGGKSDFDKESCWETAFRESREEIGFNPGNFDVELVGLLPCYLSINYMIVRPCVCFVRPKPGSGPNISLIELAPDISSVEVALVFSLDLSTFLSNNYHLGARKVPWAGSEYFVHRFEFPPNSNESLLEYVVPEDEIQPIRIPVEGFTALLMIDLARIAFDVNQPEMETVMGFGDEAYIQHNEDFSSMSSPKKKI